MRDSPLKILHVITGLGMGGAENMLHKLLSNIDAHRFSSSVVSLIQPGPLGQEIETEGTPVRSLGLVRGIPNPLALGRLVKIMREFRPDVVQGWMYHANILALVAARIAGVPKTAWNIRCSDLQFEALPRGVRWTFKAHAALSPFPDVVLVNSTSGLHFHQKWNHHPRRWEVVPNGFDLKRFHVEDSVRRRARAELGVANDQTVIGMVARLDPQKDHANFIAAARILHEREPNAVFVLAGTGLSQDNHAVVEQLRNSNLLGCTRLLGEVPDTSQLFPALDVNTLCSAFGEGFPNALGEAMSCGVPCVVTDVGDSALLVRDTGRIVPVGDARALAEAWQELIELGPGGRAELGHAARTRIVEHFSLSRIVAHYEALYSELGTPSVAGKISR